MRISNCSRESLSMNAARFTVYFLMSMGSGTGPTTSALCRAATSIICLTAPSRTPCSYARTRMRRRLGPSDFFGARGAGAAEASVVATTFLARGARAFLTVASAVIEHAEYALAGTKTQYPKALRLVFECFYFFEKSAQSDRRPSARKSAASSQLLF